MLRALSILVPSLRWYLHCESSKSHCESSKSHCESSKSHCESSKSHCESSKSHCESSKSHCESSKSLIQYSPCGTSSSWLVGCASRQVPVQRSRRDADALSHFFKIDYYNASMEFGSEDPADLTKRTRVLTIMLTEDS